MQRSNDAAEGPFAGPAIFDDFDVTVEAGIFLSAGNNRNFRSAGLRELSDFQDEWNSAKANQGFVAPKAGAGSAGQNVATRV
jgi:hypothetical protein